MGRAQGCYVLPRLADPVVLIPLVFNSILQAGTIDAPGVKGSLSRRAFASALAKLESSDPSLPSKVNPYDMLVFRKIRLAFGGRLRFLSSGSAPIAPEVLKFFRIAFGKDAIIVEGYGQTEVCETNLGSAPTIDLADRFRLNSPLLTIGHGNCGALSQ